MSSTTPKALIALLISAAITSACGAPSSAPTADDLQLIEVRFDHRTPLDEPFNHLTLWYKNSKEELILPKEATTGDAWFFDVYYTRTNNDDFTISAMVIPGPDHDTLFIDLDNDEDLTNDGAPIVMARSAENITLEIPAPGDPRQKTVLRLHREPIWITEADRQWTWEAFFDADGNLLLDNAKHFSLGRTGFATHRGHFFFDRRVGLTRGHLSIDGENVGIGIFDFDNNGLFNDPDDLVVVDRDRDGLLTVLFSTEGCALSEPFQIGENWLRLVETDRYGSKAVFEAIDPPAETATWLGTETDVAARRSDRDAPTESDLVDVSRNRPGVPGARIGTLSPDFWMTTFEGTRSETLTVEDYRGSYLLLNFWGDWCAPCIAEIPDLVEASARYSIDGLKIISFLNSQSPERATRFIEGLDADWPQVVLSDELEKRFHIGAYPTNILILPDGETYLRTGSIDEAFFESFIENRIIPGS